MDASAVQSSGLIQIELVGRSSVSQNPSIQKLRVLAENTLDAVHVFILTHAVDVHSYERCFDGLTAGARRRKNTRSYEEFLVVRIPYADTLPGPRFGIEWGQVDAIHRIPRIQEVMD
jgi:hypothetical protein